MSETPRWTSEICRLASGQTFEVGGGRFRSRYDLVLRGVHGANIQDSPRSMEVVRMGYTVNTRGDREPSEDVVELDRFVGEGRADIRMRALQSLVAQPSGLVDEIPYEE